MSKERPDVTVLLVHRLWGPGGRELAAWEEAAAAYAGRADLHHVWAGHGVVPGGIELPSPASALHVLGLSPEACVLVAESDAVPGPHLIGRLVEEMRASPHRVVDARVLPVELTRTNPRPRGLHLSESADPDDPFLEEERYPVEVEVDVAVHDLAGDEADTSSSDVRAGDGSVVHPRATAACTAVRARDLLALDQPLLAEPSEASGADLVDAATAHELEVVVATTAAVSIPVRLGWDARPAGRVPVPLEREPVWPSASHPAGLPASSLGRLLEQFSLPVPAGTDAEVMDARAPFLSIVTRTQGKRLHCLEDMFTCLAGQTDRDFEVLVMAHRVDEHHLAAVHEVVAALPSWLTQVIRVVPVERPGRAAPLNEGFEAARGHYVVALDDDDTVLAHYVATFKERAADHYGRLLRVVTARQDIAPVGDLDTLCAVSVDDPFREWPMDFDLVAHLTANYTPFMSIAFPRGAMRDLGIAFDESLNTTEDWDFLVRSAAVLGVESIREVTCVYRWWTHTGSSREAHSQDEWDEARLRVAKRFGESVLLLQSADIQRLVEAVQHSRRVADDSQEAARQMATSQHETNLEMTKVFDAYQAAVQHRKNVEERLDEVRGQLRQAREKLRRRTGRVRLLEARSQVQERLRRGTLQEPAVPLSDLSLEQLLALADSPETLSWWRRLTQA